MYKDLGIFGCINIRPLRYAESIILDKEHGYRLGFDIELWPCLRITNDKIQVSASFRWVLWEAMWWHYKEWYYRHDENGEHEVYHGVRYFLSLKWLFNKKKNKANELEKP